MKKYITLILLLVAGARLAAQNEMPEKRPSGFKLSYHFDGGMRYHFEDIVITEDSCVYKINLEGRILTKRFVLTATELDGLYDLLQKNQFNRIRYKNNGHVYDRGGESIAVNWGNGISGFSVSNAQSNFVDKDWMTNWLAVCSYVKSLPGKQEKT